MDRHTHAQQSDRGEAASSKVWQCVPAIPVWPPATYVIVRPGAARSGEGARRRCCRLAWRRGHLSAGLIGGVVALAAPGVPAATVGPVLRPAEMTPSLRLVRQGRYGETFLECRRADGALAARSSVGFTLLWTSLWVSPVLLGRRLSRPRRA